MRSGTICILFAAALHAQLLVGDVSVSGVHSLNTAEVVRFTGLTPGRIVNEGQLNAVCHKLVDSGFFTSASYGYAPKKHGDGYAYSIFFTVTEDKGSRVPVVLDIAGLDDAEFWQTLLQKNSLLNRLMPDNDAAQNFYLREIGKELGGKGPRVQLVAKREVDFTTGKGDLVIRRAEAPILSALRFAGNVSVPSAELDRAIHAIVVGEPYSERSLRQVLTLNLVPLYEEKGFLRVAFPSVTSKSLGGTAVSATVSVEEGHTWKLGKVELAGNDLPISEMKAAAEFPGGSLANWPLILASIQKSDRVMRSHGYLHVESRPARQFREGTDVVDLTVNVVKGPQFRFGDVTFDGVDPDAQDLLSRRWELHSGAPLNDGYIDDFISEISHVLRRPIKAARKEYKTRPDGSTVDVLLRIALA